MLGCRLTELLGCAPDESGGSGSGVIECALWPKLGVASSPPSAIGCRLCAHRRADSVQYVSRVVPQSSSDQSSVISHQSSVISHQSCRTRRSRPPLPWATLIMTAAIRLHLICMAVMAAMAAMAARRARAAQRDPYRTPPPADVGKHHRVPIPVPCADVLHAPTRHRLLGFCMICV